MVDGLGIEPNPALLTRALPRCASTPPFTTERRPGRGSFFISGGFIRRASVEIGFQTPQCSLDNSIRRQLHRCLKLAAKLLGFSAYSDSKGSSKFTRHGRPPVVEAFMPACTRTRKMGNF
jgi:hypothetical protein